MVKKLTTKDKVLKRFFPDEYAVTQAVSDILEGGLHLPLHVQQARLIEASGDLFNELVSSADYVEDLDTYNQADRRSDILFNYQMYYTNGTFSGLADRYLDYGIGKRVTVSSTTNADVVKEASHAVRNTPVLGVKNFRQMGLDFLMQGESLFVVWFDLATGLSTIDRLPTLDITIQWADTLTMNVPQLFILDTDEGVVVYRDWRTTDDVVNAYLSENDGAVSADELESNVLGLTHACVWAVGAKRHFSNGRGMPILNNVTKESRYMSMFIDQRYAVSTRSATYKESYKVKGTNSDLSNFINRENSFAPFGSANVSNEGVDREWNNNPTGANSERFNQHMTAQSISASTGINGAMLGIPSMLSNRSVLDKLMDIFVEYIEGFQNTLADTIRDVFMIVILADSSSALFGKPELLLETVDRDVVVTLDTPINIDITAAMSFIEQMRNKEVLTPEEELRVVSLETAVFNKFGIQ